MTRRRACLAVVVMLAAGGLGANLRAAIPDAAIATPIEQALIEQACSTPPAIAIDPDKHDECLHTKLASLRTNFGRDLNKLSSGDRRRIDAACEPIRGAEGREGYLRCLAGQLAALQARLSRGRGPAGETAPVAIASPETPMVVAAAPTPEQGSGRSGSRIWIVVMLTLATLSAAGVGLFFAVKARPRASRVCRVCGTGVEGAGDLCASCRREAAEAVRRAAAERADRQRAHEDQDRQQRDHEEEERRRIAQEAEEAQLQQGELSRQCDEAALKAEEAAQRRDAERSEAAEATHHPVSEDDAIFDPYRVLAVPHDANADVIRAAYKQAKSKYDLGEVEGLGDEIKHHYNLKAQEVDRAFQMLADSHGFPPVSQSPDLPADHLTGVSNS
jgi:hypothetical protein